MDGGVLDHARLASRVTVAHGNRTGHRGSKGASEMACFLGLIFVKHSTSTREGHPS